MQSLHIKKFVENSDDINALVTKFGGQPHWLEHPQWPLSRSTGQPMKFIGQIVLEKNLFPVTTAKIAYLFMSDSEDDFIDGTYEPDAGENAVILQPGDNNFVELDNLNNGPRCKSAFSIELIVNEPEDAFEDNKTRNSLYKEEYPTKPINGITAAIIGAICSFR